MCVDALLQTTFKRFCYFIEFDRLNDIIYGIRIQQLLIITELFSACLRKNSARNFMG